ncbi:hypothetical protein MIMGU_mgv1a021995mg, partial [Erythranthe guttata]
NSMRNFSIQCVFLNNLIFQLFNHFILQSSILATLVNINMFRCNNKILIVTIHSVCVGTTMLERSSDQFQKQDDGSKRGIEIDVYLCLTVRVSGFAAQRQSNFLYSSPSNNKEKSKEAIRKRSKTERVEQHIIGCEKTKTRSGVGVVLPVL